jgi:hypothetical protein
MADDCVINLNINLIFFISKRKLNFVKHGKVFKITQLPRTPLLSRKPLPRLHIYRCLCIYLGSLVTIHSDYQICERCRLTLLPNQIIWKYRFPDQKKSCIFVVTQKVSQAYDPLTSNKLQCEIITVIVRKHHRINDFRYTQNERNCFDTVTCRGYAWLNDGF